MIADWAAAVRRGDADEAAGFFDLPAIVHQPGGMALQVNTPQIAAAFNASLPCGAKLLATNPEGRNVVATFVPRTPDSKVGPEKRPQALTPATISDFS